MNPSEYLRATAELITSIQSRFLELGARLFKIREEKLWVGSFDSYVDFLDSARISESQASIFASIHEHYVLGGGFKTETLAKIGYSKLHQVIPLIGTQGMNEAISKALTLSRDEIKKELRQAKHGEHLHTLSNALFAPCSTCNQFLRVNSIIEEKYGSAVNLEGFTVKE